MQTHERNKPLNHIGLNEYGFFVRMSNERFEGGNSVVENTFDTWSKGKANEKICWTISVEKLALKSFLDTWKTVYLYCECIAVPENSTDTIEGINEKLNISLKSEMSEMDKIKATMEEMAKQNAELREELEKKNIVNKKEKKTK